MFLSSLQFFERSSPHLPGAYTCLVRILTWGIIRELCCWSKKCSTMAQSSKALIKMSKSGFESCRGLYFFFAFNTSYRHKIVPKVVQDKFLTPLHPPLTRPPRERRERVFALQPLFMNRFGRMRCRWIALRLETKGVV